MSALGESDESNETNPPTVCGEDHPSDMYCERCTVTLDMRARFLAVPVYDINYLVPALLEQDPALANEPALSVVLDHLGYDNKDCIVLNLDDLDDPVDPNEPEGHGSSYATWVRALIKLLGEHEVRSSYFRIGE